MRVGQEDLEKEIDQQIKMINDYTRSVEIIKLKHIHIFKQIEDILKPQIVRQHQTEIHLRSKLRSTNLTANDSLNIPKPIKWEEVQDMLDGRGFPKEKTQSHESQEIIERKHKSPCDTWLVGLKKSHEVL